MQNGHQILSLREYYDENRGKHDKKDSQHFKENWRANSIPELFQNLKQHVKAIPETERYNIYYTVASCTERKREFREQSAIIFDVDGIEVEDEARGFEIDGIKFAAAPINPNYLKAMSEGASVALKDVGFVFSGNGLHLIITLTAPFSDTNFFDTHRIHYAAILTKIKAALQKYGLPGDPDPSVFDARRIMRMPGTLNRKPNKPERMAVLMKGSFTPLVYDLTLASGLPKVEARDHVTPQVLKKYPTPDTQAVTEGCDFLKWAKEKPNEVSEAQWYAMLSVVPRCPPNGRQLAHDYSRGHKGYTPGETEAKIDQALASSGPRTCQNIGRLWGKCEGCKHFGKVTSPIMIQGETYIKTRDNGFHDIVLDKNGNPRPGKPNYEDLRRFFHKEHPYVTLGASKMCFTWQGTHWEKIEDTYLENFAQAHFFPIATTSMTQEFKNLVTRTNIQREAWWTTSIHRKMNFKNGVLDLNTMELMPHSQEYGFRYVLHYDYDPAATAPVFEKFLLSIMDGRQELVDILLEFAGYAFSNDDCWQPMCLMLTGEGSNGKSTFMWTLQSLAGKENYSSVGLGDLKDATYRQMIDGKLFNLAEETPSYTLFDSSLFKAIVDGGEMTIKVLYKQPYTIQNRAKFMFACNELPRTKDTTYGFFRRWLIVPFDKRFDGAAKDSFLKIKLAKELPGIFNLVIKGYQRLWKQQKFTESTVVDDQMKAYRLDADSVRAYIEENVTIHPMPSTVWLPIAKLYASYTSFAESRGEKPEIFPTFARRLSSYIKEAHGSVNERKKQNVIEGKRQQGLFGITYADGSQF